MAHLKVVQLQPTGSLYRYKYHITLHKTISQREERLITRAYFNCLTPGQKSQYSA